MIRLTPLVDPLIQGFIDEKDTLSTVVNAFGSPLNIIFPQRFSQNIEKFKTVFKEEHIDARMYYAHKANKSIALLREAYKNNISIDVASVKELHHVLAAGFTGTKIEVTGPKNTELLLLSLQHDCLIQVDNMSELKEIVSLQKKLNSEKLANILIRLTGFASSDTKIISKDSRFGIPIKDTTEVITYLVTHKECTSFQGLAFHLDSNTPKEKAIALENLFQISEAFQNAGLVPQTYSIGGGFKINYIAKESEWNTFKAYLQKAAMGEGESITWNNTNFGYRNEQNVLRGNSNFYEYYTKSAGSKYLKDILSTPLTNFDNISAGELVSETMKHLIVEPGRSLLDQVGVTIARVNFVKKSSLGEILVGLDMNRSNLASTDQEMMLDPIILYQNESGSTENIGVYFVGNLCLEADFIYRHKTYLSQLPEKGDLVIFVNTAAYNMDFTESETLQQRTAKKIVVIEKNNSFQFFEDEQYNPYLHN